MNVDVCHTAGARRHGKYVHEEMRLGGPGHPWHFSKWKVECFYGPATVVVAWAHDSLFVLGPRGVP